MNNHVTQDQFNNQLVLIHHSINDNNLRTDKHLTTLSESLTALAKESSETRTEILGLVKGISFQTNLHENQIGTMASQLKALEKSSIIRGAWWGVAGVIATSLLGVATKLLFFPAPPL